MSQRTLCLLSPHTFQETLGNNSCPEEFIVIDCEEIDYEVIQSLHMGVFEMKAIFEVDIFLAFCAPTLPIQYFKILCSCWRCCLHMLVVPTQSID